MSSEAHRNKGESIHMPQDTDEPMPPRRLTASLGQMSKGKDQPLHNSNTIKAYQALGQEVDGQRVRIREQLRKWPAFPEWQCPDVIT